MKDVSDRIERSGLLVLRIERSGEEYWVNHFNIKYLNNKDIGAAAREAGYEDGDSVEYEIIIKKKK